MKLFTILFFCIITLNVSAQKLILSTSGDISTFKVGEAIQFKLTFSELKGNTLINPENGVTIIDLGEFKKNITIVFENEGKHKIGPYEIKINNKVIKSNSINIDILKPSAAIFQQDTIIELIAPDKINKGNEFDIIINSNIKLYKPKFNPTKKNTNSMLSNYQRLEVKKTKFIKQINFSTNSSMTFNNGKTTNKYTYTFKVKALKKGIIIINSDFFSPKITTKIGEKLIEIN